MKKIIISSILVLSLFGFMSLNVGHAEARARYGSHRVGGYNSHGKGSHYVGVT